MKNKLKICLIALVVIVTGVGGYFVYQSHQTPTTQENHEKQTASIKSDSKILVVYYSAQNHTRNVAKKVADNLNADLYEIQPANPYSEDDLDWSDNDSRVTREHEDESLRNIELKSTEVENWNQYDTVLIGYPIWWGIAAWPVDTFVKAQDFSNKTVIPFCTSASSSIGESGTKLQDEAKDGNWQEGHRFSSIPSESAIKEWTDQIK